MREQDFKLTMLWYDFYGHPIGYLLLLGCIFAPKYPGEGVFPNSISAVNHALAALY